MKGMATHQINKHVEIATARMGCGGVSGCKGSRWGGGGVGFDTIRSNQQVDYTRAMDTHTDQHFWRALAHHPPTKSTASVRRTPMKVENEK